MISRCDAAPGGGQESGQQSPSWNQSRDSCRSDELFLRGEVGVMGGCSLERNVHDAQLQTANCASNRPE